MLNQQSHLFRRASADERLISRWMERYSVLVENLSLGKSSKGLRLLPVRKQNVFRLKIFKTTYLIH